MESCRERGMMFETVEDEKEKERTLGCGGRDIVACGGQRV